MRPAYSVILLTTLIGAAQGLFIALVTVQGFALVGLLPAGDYTDFYAQGSALALGLLVAGLAASFFHLGRPERAWRSAAMWRTSWLSREVIALPAFMGVVALYGAAHATGWTPEIIRSPGGLSIDASFVLGVVGAVLALVLFLCTAMIYACVRFLAEWHTPLTLVNYLLLGVASGLTLGAAFAAFAAPALAVILAPWAVTITLLAALGRIASLWRNARLKPKSTPQSAIGIKHPVVVQKSMGFMGGSFNTQEFFHGRSAALLRSIKWVFLITAFALPVLLILLAGTGSGAAPWLVGAFGVQYVGLLLERWYFFAQANHPQNLYYQAVS